MKAPISDTGMVTKGIRVARQLRRNRKITATTSTIASSMVLYTASIDFSMKIELSKPTRICMPSGSAASMRGSSALTARATSSVLAVDCLTMPRPTAARPLTRTILRSSSAPISARPMSASRTSTPPLSRMMTRSNSAGVLRSVSASTVNSRVWLSMRPEGSSVFWLRSAASRSCTVTPSAAIRAGSSQMRMA
jgi:hypothetical protein